MKTTNKNNVADKLVKAHMAVLADLRELQQASLGENLEELRTRLTATRTHIIEHFRFEERDGYMESVRKREPRLERTVEELAREHGRLKQSLEALVAMAREAASLNDSLRKWVQDWIDNLRRHEIRENDLVQDVFNLDVGIED